MLCNFLAIANDLTCITNELASDKSDVMKELCEMQQRFLMNSSCSYDVRIWVEISKTLFYTSIPAEEPNVLAQVDSVCTELGKRSSRSNANMLKP